MGKYAPFILAAYGITAAVWTIMVAGSLAQARRWKKRAEELAGK